MAQGYVAGAAAIWIGVRPTYAGGIQAILRTGGGQATLSTGPPEGGAPPQSAPPGYAVSPGLGGNPNPAGTIINNPIPYPTGTLINNQQPMPFYLGSARVTPRIEIMRGWAPWRDDELGLSLPADELYEGEEALVVADINRWNEPVYAYIASMVAAQNGYYRGVDVAGDVGTSMVMEGYSYPLWIQFPYAAKPAMAFGAGGPMPAGYLFYNAALLGPDRLEPINYEPSERRLVWRCRRYLEVVSGDTWLYGHDTSALGIIN